MSDTYEYLGEYLIKKKVVTEEQVQSALSRQKLKVKNDKKGLLGQVLIELGYCSEEDITMAMAEKAGVPYMSLKENPPNPAAVKLLKPSLAREYEALPIAFKSDTLLVAMKHPNDLIAVDDLRILIGYRIQPVMICDSELDTAIKHYYNNDNFFSLKSKSSEDPLNADNTLDASNIQIINIDTLDSDNSIVKISNMILSQAISSGASDIHIDQLHDYVRIRFRIDGVLFDMMRHPKEIYGGLISRFKVMSGMDITDKKNPQDGRIALKINNKMYNLKVATMPALNNEKMTISLSDKTFAFKNLHELGFFDSQLDIINKMIHKLHGLILVSGSAGSGKSTTLYSILAQLNSSENHIITLENPIELSIQGITQTQISPKAGFTFPAGVRAALSNNPDIIMISEIRDRETAIAAMEAALSGHLVLASLNADDSASAIIKLNEMGIAPYLINTALIGVIAQKQIRVLCSNCKTEYNINANELANQFSDYMVPDTGNELLSLFKPCGCSKCNFTGYQGRKGIYEVLVNNDSIKLLISKNLSRQKIHQAAVDEGMISLDRAGLTNVIQGITSLNELLRIFI